MHPPLQVLFPGTVHQYPFLPAIATPRHMIRAALTGAGGQVAIVQLHAMPAARYLLKDAEPTSLLKQLRRVRGNWCSAMGSENRWPVRYVRITHAKPWSKPV